MTTKCNPTKPCRVIRLPWHCLVYVWGRRGAITDNDAMSSVPKWYVTTIIRVYLTLPGCLLVKKFLTPSRLPVLLADKLQDAIEHKDMSPDYIKLYSSMPRLMTCGAYYGVSVWGHSNRPDTASICNTRWRWFDTPLRYMGLDLICLMDCIEISLC